MFCKFYEYLSLRIPNTQVFGEFYQALDCRLSTVIFTFSIYLAFSLVNQYN